MLLLNVSHTISDPLLWPLICWDTLRLKHMWPLNMIPSWMPGWDPWSWIFLVTLWPSQASETCPVIGEDLDRGHEVGMTASDSRLGVNAVTQALPVPKVVHFVQINRNLRRVPIPSVTCISWARCALRSLACEWRCEIYVLRSHAQPLCESRRVKKVRDFFSKNKTCLIHS
jgi:hypothetical protein